MFLTSKSLQHGDNAITDACVSVHLGGASPTSNATEYSDIGYNSKCLGEYINQLANLIKLGSKVMTGHLNTVVLNDLDTFVS